MSENAHRLVGVLLYEGSAGGTEDVPIDRSTTSRDGSWRTHHFQTVGAGDPDFIEVAYFTAFEVSREAFLVHDGILGPPDAVQ